jgi:hypothetical protein
MLGLGKLAFLASLPFRRTRRDVAAPSPSNGETGGPQP